MVSDWLVAIRTNFHVFSEFRKRGNVPSVSAARCWTLRFSPNNPGSSPLRDGLYNLPPIRFRCPAASRTP